MRINHNSAATNTYSKLSSAQGAQAKSLEKLSSGLRINRAGDDAAGLAISEKMRGQISGLNQASRNAQDGISLIQTAEGGLNETHSILQRMRELAVQSANDTNTDDDRVEIQKEMNQLSAEVSRISSDTQFNGKELLDGKFDAKFHIGANTGQNLTLKVSDMSSSALGVEGKSEIKQSVTATTTGLTLAKDIAIALTVSQTEGDVSHNLTASKLETSATVDSVEYGYALKNANGNTVALSTDGKEYKFLDETAVGEELSGAGFADATAKVDFGSAKVTSGKVTVTATTAGTDPNELLTTISATAVEGTIAVAEGSLGEGKYEVVEVGGNLKLRDSSNNIVAESSNGKTFTSTESGNTVFISENTLQANDEINISGSGIDVSTQEAADAAISTIDTAIKSVSSERSKLGATQNRLDHTINNLTATSENISAAESRIRDVDMAKEMMEFTKNNILSQAGTAMLAQANQMPQGVLQLLG